MILFRLLFILLCMLSLGACKEDYTYPNVLTELAEVETDKNGYIKQLTTDYDKTFNIISYESKGPLVPDTLYRMLTVFEEIKGNEAQLKLYSAQPIFSELTRPFQEFKDSFKCDPVDIQSIWMSKKYLNFILHVQTKDKPHRFHFVDLGIRPADKKYSTKGQTSQENKMLEIALYHDKNNDYEAFTSKYCFSIPLKPYMKTMKEGDVIRLHINTYKEGQAIRDFHF